RKVGVFRLENRRLRTDLIALHNSRKEQARIGLFSTATSARTRGHSLRLWFRLDSWRNSSTKGVIRHWNVLPGEWRSHHPWRCSRKGWMWHSVPLSSSHGGVQSRVGLDDLRGLFQPNPGSRLVLCIKLETWRHTA
ncbi:hypothetical protein Nmel_004000, partial [Mimus melanotis]